MAYKPDGSFTFTGGAYTPDGTYDFGSAYVDASASLNNTQSIDAVSDTYQEAEATLAQDNALSATSSTLYNVESAIASGQSISADPTKVLSSDTSLANAESITANAHKVLDAQSVLNEDHIIDATAVDNHNAESILNNTNSIDALATKVVSAEASLVHSHTVPNTPHAVHPVATTLTNLQSINSSSTVVLNIAAGLIESQNLINTGSAYRSLEASLLHSHALHAVSDGGSPVPDKSVQVTAIEIADDPINSINTLDTQGMVTKSWEVDYNTVGGSIGCGDSHGLNTTPLNTNELNTCPPSTLDIEIIQSVLQQTYVLGDSLFELGQTYTRALDAPLSVWDLAQDYRRNELLFSLNQEYTLGYGTSIILNEFSLHQMYALDTFYIPTLTEFELGVEYNIVGMDWVLELLGYVNEHRANFGLIPIEGVWDPSIPDIAQGHSNNMASTDIFAHESLGFPAGWETVDSRLSLLDDADQVTSYAENLIYTEDNPARILMGLNAYSSYGTSLDPISPESAFLTWRSSPPHNANMLWPWEESDHPVMGFGLSSGNYDPVFNNISVYLTQAFFAYGIPLGVDMQTFELTQSYAVTTGAIGYLSQTYVLDALSKARNQHEAVYNITLSLQHESPYTSRVSVQHEALISYILSVQHEAVYSYSDVVAVQHEAVYDMPVRNVVVQHEVLYGLSLQKQHEAIYSLLHNVAVQHEAPYTDKFYVTTQHESIWDINTVNIVRASHSAYWTMEADTVYGGSTPQIVVKVDGLVIPVIESIISSSEGQALWTCKLILDGFAHYNKFTEGKQFTVDLQGDIYTFQYHTKSVNRAAPAYTTLVVEGMSPALSLQSPRATLITKEYTTSTLAQDIIEDILGQAVTWEIPAWYIPANTVVASDAEPLGLATTIIETVGGLLESNIDGSLLVRKKYKVNTTVYSSVIPDQVYSDTVDNLSAIEAYEVRVGYNVFRVTDTDDSYSDTLSFVQDEDNELEGLIRAYPTPWRTSIEVITTDRGVIYLGNPRWSVRDEENVVEFTEGSATLSYIAESITSVVWHSVSLGGILHTAYSNEITTSTTVNNGYGLATVSYKVKCLEYDTVGVTDSHAQYIIVDL